MNKEVFFDLDANKELEGNYFNCNVKLIDSVFALLENGYEVIDCKLSDPDNIYLKSQDVIVDVKENRANVDDIIQEGKYNNEYRRITHKDYESIRYDSFSADDNIEIKILGKHNFSNVPEGCRVISFDDCTVIKFRIKQQEYEDNMYGYPRKLKKLDISSTIEELESWIGSITGKKVEHKEFVNNSYGNSEMAIDYEEKKIIDCNYVLLDHLMIPIISELREKGYQTLGCCSGHFDSVFIQNTGIDPEEQFIPKKVESWIVFSNESPVPVPPENAECSEVSKFYRVSYSHSIFNSDGTYKPASVIKEEIEESITKLLEWAKSLPYATTIKHSM